jgi:hypothetical protein
LILATLALLCGAIRQANADQIVNQHSSSGGDVSSQLFPDETSVSKFAFDDFVTTRANSLTSLAVYGAEGGGSEPSQNVAVTAEIWNGLPGTGSIVHSFSGTEDGSGNLDFNLGGYVLPAGSYWLSAYVTRPLNPGGQWFWRLYTPVNGAQAELYSPGEASTPSPIGDLFGVPFDLQFTLSGDAVSAPEPASEIGFAGLCGMGLIGFARSRRRKI